MDTNFNNQEIKDCEITYHYWCDDCLEHHPTLACPKDINSEKVLVYDLCPTCGQEICG